MRGRLTSAFVVGVALAVLLAPRAGSPEALVASAAPSGDCLPRGSKTVVASSSGRIYSKRGKKDSGVAENEPGVRYFGCLYSTGRSYVLAFAFEFAGDLAAEVPHTFRLGGRYAAFLVTTAGEHGYGIAVVRRDLKTGAWRRDDRPALMPSDPSDSPFREESYSPSELVVRPTGALAWIVAADERCADPWPCRVLKADRDGRAVLDQSTGIDPESLTLKGRTITWISNGKRRSATLR